MKRKGEPIHGWIALDKPVGLTSTQALAAVRRAAGAGKAGHGGTLDPLASGLLPIALGEATKTVQWAMAGTKTYRLTVRWGIATATDDREGAVTETADHRPSPAEIEAALPAFTGDILQVPSTYSAILVGGKRAYDLARAGVDFALEPRPARIDRITLLACDDADHATLEVICGKGVYMRSLGRDLARHLGTVGHLSALRRLTVGRFAVARAISMEKLPELAHKHGLSEHLLPVETALDDIPALALTEAEAQSLRQGRFVRPSHPPDGVDTNLLGDAARGDGSIVAAMANGRLVAIAELREGLLRPVRVLNP